MLTVRVPRENGPDNRTVAQRARELSLPQLVVGAILLNLFLGGLEQVFVRPSGQLQIVGVLPAWLIFVGLIAFLRDDSAFEAGMLVGAATAAGIVTKLALAWITLRLQGRLSVDATNGFILSYIMLPLLGGVLAAMPAAIVVGIVRIVQRLRARTGSA